MTDNPHSSLWYRIAKIKPKLHAHVEIDRHNYRNQVWYLLENTVTTRSHRFNPVAYKFIGLLNGKRSIQDIYDHMTEQMDENAPNQAGILQLLAQLDAADLISTEVLINTEALFERQSEQKSFELKQRFSNPISQKIPLWDPDNFLNKHENKVKSLFTFWAAIIWSMTFIYTLSQATIHWQQISQHFNINSLSNYNLLLLFLLYPPIKLLHELGHAFSAKLEGGEVHEMGINFLLFMPIPYVNVSTATHFRSKYKRILVSAAGIIVETFLAALGLLLFLAVEPGFIQDIGFNIFIIGGISSLFFNGNPLLKFDGYYILADVLDIPNLYQRSSQYWRYLFQRYLFGLRHAISPVNVQGESFWLFVYSLASLAYRLTILWFICFYVTEKFFFLGIILAIWLLTQQILLPIYKTFRFIFSSQALYNKRSRAVISSLGLTSFLAVIFGFTPLPSYTNSEGIVWLPEEAQLKAEQNGFAGDLQVKNMQIVSTGTPVIQLYDPFLDSKVKIAKAKLQELQSLYRAERGTKKFVEAELVKEKIRVAEYELHYARNKTKGMSILAKKSGEILIPNADDLLGRFIRHGELLGYILKDSPSTIRMAVKQDDIGLLRQNIKAIKIRFANNLNKEFSAKIIRQAPEATNNLPSMALSSSGGGKIVLDPDSEDGALTLEKVFLIDLYFDPKSYDIPLGTRAYVRINHGGETLAIQWFRRLRQVFLRHTIV